jgi:indolepyruvate ferredoxin oxidoreductase beta subunit
MKKREKREYITVDTVVAQIKQVTPHIFVIDGTKLAGKAGYTRAENVVLLGAACGLPGFPLDKEGVGRTLLKVVPPKWVDVNMKAFELGYQEVLHFFKNV